MTTSSKQGAGPRYSLDLHEAVGQLTDLWQGVPEFRFARCHRYPAGDEAVWMFLSASHAAVPSEHMGFPVVAIIGERP